MKRLAFTLVILAACGSKQQQPTTPSNSADDAKTGAMGGKTYGGHAAPAPTPSTDAPSQDPCAMP
ncbi:MAG TPA: hypothetical protein VGM39_02200 [Kofleriaceae bacterium]|jgi:hypothetical protein